MKIILISLILLWFIAYRDMQYYIDTHIKVHYIILLYVITYKKTNILYIKCSIVYILKLKPERIGIQLRL